MSGSTRGSLFDFQRLQIRNSGFCAVRDAFALCNALSPPIPRQWTNNVCHRIGDPDPGRGDLRATSHTQRVAARESGSPKVQSESAQQRGLFYSHSITCMPNTPCYTAYVPKIFGSEQP